MTQITPDKELQAAIALHRAGRLQEAQTAYEGIIQRNPDHHIALNLLGVLAGQGGRAQQAVEYLSRAVSLCPTKPDYHCNLGNAYTSAGSPQKALEAFKEAIRLNPRLPEAHFNLACLLKKFRQFDAAIAGFQEAIKLRPAYFDALNNLGNAYIEKNQPQQAIECFRKALAINANSPAANCNLGVALGALAELDISLEYYRKALALDPKYGLAHNNLIFGIHFHPDCDDQTIAAAQVRWSQQLAQPLTAHQPHSNTRDPQRHLRIGYVSPDLREHAVGHFMLSLLAAHDHAAFEIHAYADVPAPDAMTAKLKAHCDHWHSLVGMNDQSAAQLIRSHQVDILIDLAAHTAGNRLLLFARKPAPVQATYLAYCSGTGLTTIDYRISDPFLDPPATLSPHYIEQTVHLPETYWCYPPPAAAPEVNDLPALKNGIVTFGCLNQFIKVSRPIANFWKHILMQVPKSQLILHAHPGPQRDRVAAFFADAGIAPQRLQFVERLPLPDYFRLYHSIDLALDPFPYSGGTTTCDALYMGVPVITLSGKMAVGRGGVSILSNVGFQELIATTPEAYIQTAVQWANDLPRLKDVRTALRGKMRNSSLMNAPRFAKNFEAALRTMWSRWCQAAN